MQNPQSQFSWKNISDLNTSQHIQYSQILIPFRFEYASLVSCPLWNQHEATLNQQFVLVGSCNLDLICHPKKLGWFSELTFWPVTSGLCIQIQNYRSVYSIIYIIILLSNIAIYCNILWSIYIYILILWYYIVAKCNMYIMLYNYIFFYCIFNMYHIWCRLHTFLICEAPSAPSAPSSSIQQLSQEDLAASGQGAALLSISNSLLSKRQTLTNLPNTNILVAMEHISINKHGWTIPARNGS